MSDQQSRVYDGIIIGSGHNSLVLQAYLCKAGLDILCIERRSIAGGGLATMEDPKHPGFLHNTHSFYHRSLNQMPWYKDLELERHGAVYIEPDYNVALLLKNGESLDWWTSFDKTVESFSRFSKKDAQALKKWREIFFLIVDKKLILGRNRAPLLPPSRRGILQKKGQGR